jgi:hypothetical protein
MGNVVHMCHYTPSTPLATKKFLGMSMGKPIASTADVQFLELTRPLGWVDVEKRNY